jgi:hypothetical protein
MAEAAGLPGRRLRSGFLVCTAFALVVLVVKNADNSESFSSLAGIRIDSDSDIPVSYHTQATQPSESSVFNPEYDPDAPSRLQAKSSSLQANAEPMGVNDIQTALAGLESKDVPKASTSRHADLLSIKTDDLFDPSKDPDAPKPRLSSLQRQELVETAKANQMKAQLKIEAQLAMLTQREKSRKTHDAEKAVKARKDDAKPAKPVSTVHAHSDEKPSIRSISEEVRNSLDKGFDPSKIITKELQSEMQVSL